MFFLEIFQTFRSLGKSRARENAANCRKLRCFRVELAGLGRAMRRGGAAGIPDEAGFSWRRAHLALRQFAASQGVA
jgi:hypothetical protein